MPSPRKPGALNLDNAAVAAITPKRLRDVMGRLKISQGQNIYDADFEYGVQSLRWEQILAGAATVAHLPGEGGVRLRLSSASGDVAIRQSRPYHRYQPGKSMFMASAVNFGAPNVNQVQRVGYFDDNNGIFFQQSVGAAVDPALPSGMSVVVRTDAQTALTQGRPTDTVVPLYMWSDPQNVAATLDWTRIQMLWLEYAWYGAGALRWGVLLDGEPIILHDITTGNNGPLITQKRGTITAGTTTSATISGVNFIADQYVGRRFLYSVAGTQYTARITANTATVLTLADVVSGAALSVAPTAGQPWSILNLPAVGRSWARTGNLPVRYEQRNTGASVQNDMVHFGVSVMVEGGVDDQRGFTYAYGSPWNATSANAGRRSVAGSGNRIPVVSVRNRIMGTQEFTQATAAITSGTTSTLVASSATWTIDQWAGRMVNYGTAAAGMLPNVARIVSNTATTLNLVDNITGGTVTAPTAGQSYIIGQINRGQILPRRLQITSDQAIFVEIVTSTPTSPISLTGANFVANAATPNSFALVDNSATAYTASGETVYSIFVPANQPVDQQIDQLFPLLNTIRGNSPDILTALVTNTSASAANVSIQIIGQEAMS
jgi:hypothetical protein